MCCRSVLLEEICHEEREVCGGMDVSVARALWSVVNGQFGTTSNQFRPIAGHAVIRWRTT